jgi:hypothetical protein
LKEKNSDSLPKTDLGKALQLALTLDQLRQNQNLEDLEFTRKVMKNIREIPRIKPPPTPLKLSEIAPTIPKYEEMPEEEKGILARIKKLFKRKSGGVVPA